MGTGIFNILVGLVLLGMGASGRFKLLGASPKALMVVGAGVILWGVYGIVRSLIKRKQSEYHDLD